MKLGIIETGGTPKGLERFGRYPDMFRALLGEHAYDYVVFDVRIGQWPERPEDCAGYVITGSPCGVYDKVAWIGELAEWLRTARGRTALIGICFGHQIMAQAFGGRVIKSPKGWGIGAHRYDVVCDEPWMGDVKSFVLPALHQDQVVECPPDAVVVARSAFTPFGMLTWPGERAVSLQLHPEFAPDYAAAVVERIRRNSTSVSEARADAAIESLHEPMDRGCVAGWIEAFIGEFAAS